MVAIMMSLFGQIAPLLFLVNHLDRSMTPVPCTSYSLFPRATVLTVQVEGRIFFSLKEFSPIIFSCLVEIQPFFLEWPLQADVCQDICKEVEEILISNLIPPSSQK